ncbi:MAG: NADH-quinone oxidoreductase subunit N [Pseudomonadota bacterium]|nr:NADH-quinone oxidoreductase subunit N [Pseudomonadota bacterium]
MNGLVYLPECVLLLGVLVLLCSYVVGVVDECWFSWIACITVGGAGLLCFGLTDPTAVVQGVPGLWVYDYTSYLSCCLIMLFSFMALMIVDNGHSITTHRTVEFYALWLCQNIGMLALCCSAHWLSFMVSLELMYLPLYAFVALQLTDGEGMEASIKYFIQGIAASALMLYGVSLLYSGLGYLSFEWLGAALQQVVHQSSLEHGVLSVDYSLWLSIAGCFFILVGLAFKLGVAPFHFWVVDVYSGASYRVLTLLTTIPKWVILVAWGRVIQDVMAPLFSYWQWPVWLMGVISLVWGHFGAFKQTHIKRLLGYAAIAQMGYVMLALGLATPDGLGVAMGYVFGYMVASLLLLSLLGAYQTSSGGDINQVQDLVTVVKLNPWGAGLILISVCSLIGLPPFLGFMTKLYVLWALIREWYVSMAILAMVMSIFGAVYYLRLLKSTFFEHQANHDTSIKLTSAHRLDRSSGHTAVYSRYSWGLLSVMLVVLGLYPEAFFRLVIAL